MLKKIVKFGHSVLRKQCQNLDSSSPLLAPLVRDLIQTLQEDSNGVGLSAPQINAPYRVFVIHQKRSHEVSQAILKDLDPDHNPSPFTSKEDIGVYINPRILSHSEKTWNLEEGCLSIPLLYGEVSRPWEITVSAFDENYKAFEKTLVGYEARVFLHENDHLNGVLFIDRLEKKDRKSFENALIQMKKKYKDFNKQLG